MQKHEQEIDKAAQLASHNPEVQNRAQVEQEQAKIAREVQEAAKKIIDLMAEAPDSPLTRAPKSGVKSDFRKKEENKDEKIIFDSQSDRSLMLLVIAKFKRYNFSPRLQVIDTGSQVIVSLGKRAKNSTELWYEALKLTLPKKFANDDTANAKEVRVESMYIHTNHTLDTYLVQEEPLLVNAVLESLQSIVRTLSNRFSTTQTDTERQT